MTIKEVGTKVNGNLKIILLVLALVGNGVTVGIFYGRTEARLESIDKRLERIEGGMDDRYRGVNAKRDFEVRDKRIDRLEDKLDEYKSEDK